MLAERPFFPLSRALRQRYGRRLRRVMLDLGLSCPNRDGDLGYGGCIYCDVFGSGTGAAREKPLSRQIEEGLAKLRRTTPAGPVAIAYLQSYSNTWPDLEPLRNALELLAGYREAAPIVSVSTRPDCFTPEAARLLGSFRPLFDAVWVELGLETADDRVQAIIGRHDRLENFHAACRRAHEQGVEVVAHTLAGLPGEKPGGLLRQIEEAAAARVEGIKFHQLMVLRRTKLAALWRRGEVELLDPETYVHLVAGALEILPPSVVVHRLAAEAPPAEYLAPAGWPPKGRLYARIEAELHRRGSVQGCRARARPPEAGPARADSREGGVVRAVGIEPTTNGLKARYSTN